jgi:chromate transporter
MRNRGIVRTLIYWSVFLAFFKVGLFGYGGGPAMLPLLEMEVVHNNNWMSASEFVDTLAMANTLPGPITTKMAIYVGNETAGPLGAALAISGLLLPSSVLIVAMMLLYYRFKGIPYVEGMIKAIRPVVIGLLAVTVAHLSPNSIISWDTFVIAAITFGLVYFLKLQPVYIIVAAAVFGYFVYG